MSDNSNKSAVAIINRMTAIDKEYRNNIIDIKNFREHMDAEWGFLKEYPPFNSLSKKLVLSPNASINDLSRPSLMWQFIIQQVRRGYSPIEILDRLDAEITSNKAKSELITLIEGLEVDTEIKLDEHISIVPNESLPNNAAFVQAFTHEPLLVNEADQSVLGKVSKFQEGIFERRRLAHAAVILSQEGGSLLTKWKYISREGSIIEVSGGTFGTIEGGNTFSSDANLGDIVKLYSLLVSFPKEKSASLLSAIGRLNRARLSFDQVSRYIDLGLAMEILLMHGDSQAKSELNYKIGQRAAWLLGNNVQERKTYKKKAGDLYTLRSNAAHSANADLGKIKLLGEEADAFVTKIVISILERKAFPDWSALTLGG